MSVASTLPRLGIVEALPELLQMLWSEGFEYQAFRAERALLAEELEGEGGHEDRSSRWTRPPGKEVSG